MQQPQGAVCAGCGALIDAVGQACIECGGRGSGADRREPSALRFDGGRLVTGVLSLTAFLAALWVFSAAAECSADGDRGCDGYGSVGAYFLAVAASFGIATVAPAGGWRRAALIPGMLLVLPVVVWVGLFMFSLALLSVQ